MSLFLSNLLVLRIFITVGGGGGGKEWEGGWAELKVTPPGLESAPSNAESTKFDVGPQWLSSIVVTCYDKNSSTDYNYPLISSLHFLHQFFIPGRRYLIFVTAPTNELHFLW